MRLLPLHAATALVCALWPAAWAQPAGAAEPRTVLPTRPTVTAPLLPTTTERPAGDGAETPAPDASEPRIIRGTDRVINPSRQPRIAQRAPASFKFEDAPIADVVGVVLGEVLKVDYVLHGQVTGNVTLATRAPVPTDQAMFLLESALQANGLQMARDVRGVYHIGRPDALRGIVAAPRQAVGGSLPPGHGAIVVPLQYIGATEMAAILRPLMAADSLVRVDPLRNLLVLSGTRTQAEGWLDLVSTFDVDLLKGMSVGVFPLKHASPNEVEAALRLVSGAAAAQGAAPAGQGGQAASGGENPVLGAFRVLPIQRLNSVLVVTPRASNLDEVRRWIERLDQPGDNTTEPQLFVYPVQNGNARQLADVIGSLYGTGQDSGGRTSGLGGNSVAPGLGSASVSTGTFGSTGGAFGGAGGFGGQGSYSNNAFAGTGLFGGGSGGAGLQAQGLRAQGGASASAAGQGAAGANLTGGLRVVADEVNNALLVYGTKAEYRKIESALRRLDLRPAQVLLEANIVEVTLRDELSYGLQWYFNNRGRDYGGRGSVNASGGGGVLAAAAGGFSYTLTNSLGDVRAVLNALADKSLVKVISSPSLMVLDNNTAAISVGDQQPIQSGQTITNGNQISTSIQYKDTGVQLQVTPTVNAGNLITMTVNQSVTDVGPIDNATRQRAFRQRQVGSKVAVRSGEALVMGGLIQEKSERTRSGVPLLQDLPLVGAAFSTTSVNTDRTELIVILTPRVMRADEDVRELSAELRERMRGLSAVEGYGPPRSTLYEPIRPTDLPPAAGPVPASPVGGEATAP